MLRSVLSKGFTLAELLIAIGIIAALSTVLVVSLNPVEILAQGRDGQRIAHLNSLLLAIENYINTVPSADLGICASGGICTADPGTGQGPFANTTCATINTLNNITGTGWVTIDFTQMTGRPLISFLPIDPTNSNIHFYAYRCVESPRLIFELNTRLESIRYRRDMVFDGGDRNCLCGGAICTAANVHLMTLVESRNNNCFYEVGTAPQLNI